MAAPVALTVYCAFSAADAELINNDSMVATSLFDVEFIPLKATVTASIEGAFRRKASELAHRAAVEITTWYVLELKFNAQQVCSMFLAKQLFHCRALDGSAAYRMYGDSLRLTVTTRRSTAGSRPPWTRPAWRHGPSGSCQNDPCASP